MDSFHFGATLRRELRLRKSSHFERVRRTGTSFAHPLMVAVKLANDKDHSRFGVSASRSVGNAVKRNRARRLMREALRLRAEEIAPGWDVVLLARKPLLSADYQQIQLALNQLLIRAGLLHVQAE